MKVYTIKKRPIDINQRAKLIVDIVVGDVEDISEKNKAALSLGQLDGKERSQKLSPENRLEIAKKAAKKRWDK